ncbi:DUF3152 domain-containing protein [Streptomyces thermocarboxydovorans]|uniref:DUF3152 domain-containing protein n=2 Tax=Streptomyces thermocarboxydovorans TaxID=59298 RepID=A0ABN1HQP3_9ACTN
MRQGRTGVDETRRGTGRWDTRAPQAARPQQAPPGQGPGSGPGGRTYPAEGQGAAAYDGARYDAPAHGTPPHGTPVQGAPGHGAPGRGAPGQGGPAYGAPPYGGSPRPMPGREAPRGYGTPPHGTPAQGVPRFPDGTPAHGVPRFPDGTPAHGVPRFPDGTPAHGVPRFPDGTPAHGVPRFPDGTPAHGVPRFADGTPAHGVPRFQDGTPAHGVPRFPDGTPAHGTPQVRGGHPEQREGGGGWGELNGRTAAAAGYGRQAGMTAPLPRQRQAPADDTVGAGGVRQEYLDAFDEPGDLFTPRTKPAPRTRPASDPYATVTDWDTASAAEAPDAPHETDAADDDAPPTGAPARPRGGKGRTFTGIAAAAVTTALAVVVAGQVAEDRSGDAVQAQSAPEQSRDARDPASRGDGREAPAGAPDAKPATYEQKMSKRYPLGADFTGSGVFEAIRGVDKAPGRGQKITYRVDVEKGLGLDGELFAEAVHKTLNDQRSWAHGGARTFERIHSGRPDFVITLASPGTTAKWCAKSGLDTTEDNVSCDSAATERVMINAYRWAQGAETYGDDLLGYRQMLINHEIGHRLGYDHVTCDKDGDLAPVMQQQTKFLDHDGISCRPNPWAYPNN